MMSKCSYCGSEQYGKSCLNAPDKGAIGFGAHCHKGGPGCIWRAVTSTVRAA